MLSCRLAGRNTVVSVLKQVAAIRMSGSLKGDAIADHFNV